MNKILVKNTKIGNFYLKNNILVKVIAKIKYGATLEEVKTGKRYMISPTSTLQCTKESESIFKEKTIMNSKEKKEKIYTGIMKVLEYILLTAPSTGLTINEIYQKVYAQGNFKISEIKLRNLVYSHVWYLKKYKGYKNIAIKAGRYSLRRDDMSFNISQEKNQDPKYDNDSLYIKAKDAELKKIYHSPKGIPCKLISINNSEVQMKSLITNEIISIPIDFPLVPEEKILNHIRDTKRVKK